MHHEISVSKIILCCLNIHWMYQWSGYNDTSVLLAAAFITTADYSIEKLGFRPIWFIHKKHTEEILKIKYQYSTHPSSLFCCKVVIVLILNLGNRIIQKIQIILFFPFYYGRFICEHNMGWWEVFCYESCSWCRFDQSTCWPPVQRTTTVPRIPLHTSKTTKITCKP